MSDDLYFQVFYGSGEVRYGPEGVDLSEFSSITKKVPRARERTWISISNWLFKTFGLNRDLCHRSGQSKGISVLGAIAASRDAKLEELC